MDSKAFRLEMSQKKLSMQELSQQFPFRDILTFIFLRFKNAWYCLWVY